MTSTVQDSVLYFSWMGGSGDVAAIFFHVSELGLMIKPKSPEAQHQWISSGSDPKENMVTVSSSDTVARKHDVALHDVLLVKKCRNQEDVSVLSSICFVFPSTPPPSTFSASLLSLLRFFCVQIKPRSSRLYAVQCSSITSMSNISSWSVRKLFKSHNWSQTACVPLSHSSLKYV